MLVLEVNNEEVMKVKDLKEGFNSLVFKFSPAVGVERMLDLDVILNGQSKHVKRAAITNG